MRRLRVAGEVYPEILEAYSAYLTGVTALSGGASFSYSYRNRRGL